MSRERADYGEGCLDSQDDGVAGLTRISALKKCVMRIIGSADSPPPVNRFLAVHHLDAVGPLGKISGPVPPVACQLRQHVAYLRH